VTNFEVDKTVRVTRNATGNIKRLNAAVVVNNRSVTDPKGKVTQVPLAPEELEKLTALVQESVGFNKERGDSVRVINAPFKVEPVTVVDTPLWKQQELLDMLRAAAVPAGLSLVALLVFFGMIKPSLKAALEPAIPLPGSALDASVDDVEDMPDISKAATKLLEAPRDTAKLDAARTLAKDNPAAVAQIVRGWVAGQPA
jgi:flagellar M-ring protein FliF